jgi:quercetin dioxygenase-like cupin family protein
MTEHGISIWRQSELAFQLLSDISEPTPQLGKWINGRVVGLLASPFAGNATDLAIGVSVIPAGETTPKHSHRAEEIAIILAGEGMIEIGDSQVQVAIGDVVLNPPDVPHRTEAAASGPLAVLWIYSQPDSALRWLHDGPVEESIA